VAMSRRRRRWSIEQSKRVALDRLDTIDITCIPTGEDHTRHGYGQGQGQCMTWLASLGYALQRLLQRGMVLNLKHTYIPLACPRATYLSNR
jgi:hypothetical protein